MSVKTYNKVTHCIFDMDGLLLDTEQLYSEAFNRIANRYGKEVTWELKAQTMGFKTVDVIAFMIKTLELPITVDEFQKEVVGNYRELFPRANPMPGVVRLLTHLKKNNIPIALATGSDKLNYDLKTTRWHDLFEIFNHKVLGGSDSEVKRCKPNPDIFFIAARRFSDNPDPSKCLVFEDAPNGVQAAIKAGMQVVMVPDPNLPKEYTKEATLVLNNLEEFQPEMFGLPMYEKNNESSI
ncbi:hypothetical protein PUN28_005988 [Cardiocondyla obscurior]|uniref:pseudouridine 5'-phosphatase n=1 Tax=Cardiocondyla obscurior TaxID=286306 RepID=A0AAW2G8A4_9HYME